MYTPVSRIAIIEDDNMVLIDSHKIELDLSSYLDADIWAIHWDVKTQKGEVEYNSSRKNGTLDKFDDYQSIVDAACEKVQNILDEEQAELERISSDEYKYELATVNAQSECTRRIESQWNTVGQLNAALGIYTETESDSCKAWIAAHRTALEAMLARNDLVGIDVTDDQYWPSVSV